MNNFSQKDSPSGEFLQSPEWRKFQESVGRKTHNIFSNNFYASIVEHSLPIVGKYFYVPRGPIISSQGSINSEQEIKISNQKESQKSQPEADPPRAEKIKNQNYNSKVKSLMQELVDLAKENGAGWIRFDEEDEESLDFIRKNTKHKVAKAPHDMQSREVFVINILKSEDDLLAEMKPKTRYNIRLAEKKGVTIKIEPACAKTSADKSAGKWETGVSKNVFEFLRLTKIMATRQGISPHPDEYYRKMLEVIPGNILKLYIAEYDGEVVAANLMVFYEKTATYLHGASDDKYRNLMAPYLLQWQAICDAKKNGCERYDFGGIKTGSSEQRAGNSKNTWAGITKFKLGFSPSTNPVIFLGSYDIMISRKQYFLYLFLQRVKNLFSWGVKRNILKDKKEDEKNKN